jgi:colanic acid biosynthesis protein WcaH
MLDKETFLAIVDRTPLVAVDLVFVRNFREVLLGLRKNRPAQDFWFVPGGRIFKNEKISEALVRVAGAELGLGEEVHTGQLCPRLIGSFEHFYPDCFAGECGVSTHYVVLGHRLDVPADFKLPLADAQHAEFRWWPIEEALEAAAVHRFTKDYLLAEGFASTSRSTECPSELLDLLLQ